MFSDQACFLQHSYLQPPHCWKLGIVAFDLDVFGLKYDTSQFNNRQNFITIKQ